MNKNKNINIIMVEDHPEYREIVEMAISRQDGMELTEQFGTAERALEHLRHLDEHDDMPDVILLDLNLPGMDGLEALELLATEAPKARIVALTQSDHEGDILKAVSLGASGYLLKSSTVQQLIESIKHVMEGGASLDARIAGFVMGELKARLPHQELEKMLTAREIEILGLMAEGMVKKQISEKLGISVTTVISHVGNIYEKLEASNAPSAIAKGFKLGILKLDD